MSANPWTDAGDTYLRALWDEGYSGSEIGARMGRSKGSVLGRAHRLGLPARESPIKETGAVARPYVRKIARGTPTLPALASVEIKQDIELRIVPVPIPPRGRIVAGPATCQFIKNDGRPWLFCDAPRWGESRAYCREHHSLCNRGVTASEDGRDSAPWVRPDQQLKWVA